jgi:hypothetical protein
MEAILFTFVLVLTIVLIARWRGRGVVVSVLFGWAAIHFINVAFPHDIWSDIEFAEDWPRFGWLLMLIWSLLAYVVIRSLKAVGKWWWALDD